MGIAAREDGAHLLQRHDKMFFLLPGSMVSSSLNGTRLSQLQLHDGGRATFRLEHNQIGSPLRILSITVCSRRGCRVGVGSGIRLD